jgi:uncharacterized membrane protein
MDQKQSGTRLLDRFLRAGLICIFILLLVTGFVYLSVFNNGLSKAPDNWSAFGSFFGGVFGPIVSLVTLVAILVTIELQKKLLSTQATEFESLSDLQRLSIQAQIDQANFSKLSDYKSHQLQLLEQLLNMFEKMQDRYNQEADRVSKASEFFNSRQNHLIHMDAAIKDMENVAADLIQLSMEVSLGQFQSIDQLKEFVSRRLKGMHHFFSNVDAAIGL